MSLIVVEKNVWKLTIGGFDISDLCDLEIQDGHLKIDRFLRLTWAVMGTKFETDKTDSCGENV